MLEDDRPGLTKLRVSAHYLRIETGRNVRAILGRQNHLCLSSQLPKVVDVLVLYSRFLFAEFIEVGLKAKFRFNQFIQSI